MPDADFFLLKLKIWEKDSITKSWTVLHYIVTNQLPTKLRSLYFNGTSLDNCQPLGIFLQTNLDQIAGVCDADPN